MKINLGDKIGEIIPFGSDGSNTLIGYVFGFIPVRIKTKFTQEEWKKLCNGEYGEDDMIRFKMQGKFI